MAGRLFFVCVLAVGLLVSVGSAQAHHGTNLYDMANPVVLKGTITKFERGNPHKAPDSKPRKEIAAVLDEGYSFCVTEGFAFRAFNTRSGVSGTSRKRIPVASKTALATAAGTATMGVSAAPAAGNSGRLIKAI
jgi:hypothetical protein